MRKAIFSAFLLSLAGAPAIADTLPNALTPGGALGGSELIPMFQTSLPAKSTTPAAIGTYLTGTFLVKANNLSDLASPATARTNLGFTFSGSTLKLVTQGAGSTTSGHQLVYDGSGNAIDGGAPGSGGTVTSVTCGTGLSGGTFTTVGTCSLPNTGPGAISVTNANLTFDTQGRVTAASSGAGGSSGYFTTTVATAGSSTAYTLAMAGYTAAVGNYVCAGGGMNVASGLNPTLNVQSTGAKPIKLQTATGLVSPVNSELPINVQACFSYDGTNYIYQGPPQSAPAPITTTDTITAAKWQACQQYTITTASQTITLPSAATSPTGGCAVLQTVGVTAQLCATGPDVINTGQVGASSAGGCITLPADLNAQASTSGVAGATAFTVPLGPLQYFTQTWAEGLNLSTNARYVSRFGTPKVIYGIRCNVQAAAGSASTIHLFSTPSGSAPASGTALDTTGCNANSASNTEQDMGPASGGVGTTLAGYTIWATYSGAGTSGNGGFTITYR